MEKLRLNIGVAGVAALPEGVCNILNFNDCEQFFDKDYSNLTFVLDYPLHKPVEVVIDTAKGIEDILIPIARAYKEIYDNDPGNTWGHGIGDLYFEEIGLVDGGVCTVFIGS